jgi:hypothetical protein
LYALDGIKQAFQIIVSCQWREILVLPLPKRDELSIFTFLKIEMTIQVIKRINSFS